MSEALTITNGTYANKSFAIPHAQQVGCKVFTNGTNLQYQPLREDGSCVVDSILDYTVVKTVQPSSKYFVDGGNIVDFTNSGSNVDVPEITDYEFDSEPLELNNRFWVRDVIIDGEKVGEEFAAYDKDEPAPTGACLDKTAKWAGVIL
jgi:hypothetical protein